MSLINWFEQEKGWNPVYEAARNGHKEVVMLLIEHGAKQVRSSFTADMKDLIHYPLYLLHRTMLWRAHLIAFRMPLVKIRRNHLIIVWLWSTGLGRREDWTQLRYGLWQPAGHSHCTVQLRQVPPKWLKQWSNWGLVSADILSCY